MNVNVGRVLHNVGVGTPSLQLSFNVAAHFTDSWDMERNVEQFAISFETNAAFPLWYESEMLTRMFFKQIILFTGLRNK